jgi:dUTP pyrophosphatase
MKLKVLDSALYSEELENGFGPKQPGDAGIDLRAAEDTAVGYRQTAKIPLGIAFQLPYSTVGWLTGRSSSTLAFGLLTHEGKIDSGYRGEVHGIVTALERSCEIARGERICQMVVLPIWLPDGTARAHQWMPEWRVVDELENTTRGKMGLGSTGRI